MTLQALAQDSAAKTTPLLERKPIMTNTTLRSVTLQTVANYRHAAERTLRAYRHGGQRLISVLRSSVDQVAQRGAEPYVPGLAAALLRATGNLDTLANQGLASVSERSSRAIAASADTVTAQVKRVATLAGGVDNRLVAGSLGAAVRFSLPGAQVALALSERVASGADKLADVVAGPMPKKAKKTAARRSAKVSAVEAVVAETKSAARRVKAKVVKVADSVADAVDAPAQPAKAVKAVKAVKARTKAAVKTAVKSTAKAASTLADEAVAKPARRASRKLAKVVDAAQAAAAA